jgi:hypothetical protein
MFTVSNPKKVGDLSFVTAKGRPVTLRPGKTLNFEDDDLNDGLLRVMVGIGSHYKVLADTAEAQDMIDKAKQRKAKKAGSPLVHGSTEPVEENQARNRPFVVRDLKATKTELTEAGGDGQPAAAPGGDPQDAPPAPEVTKATIHEEGPSPLDRLIEVAKDKPYGELVTEARELLGDKFPEGRPGRPAIVKALQEFKAALEPQQQAAE